MENNDLIKAQELSFFKRIALCKQEVFEGVQSEDLDKAGNNKSGYYSIKTIVTHLNPAMNKYDIDCDIVISDNLATFIWIDCNSDKTRTITLELRPMSTIERLASMQNIVQSAGAVLSYYKRYLFTTVLNLNSTDLIENSPSNQNKTQNQKSGQTGQDKPEPPVQKLANESQLKAMFTLMNIKGVTKEAMKKSIKKQYNIDSSKQLTIRQYNDIMKYFKSLPDKPKETKNEGTNQK